jgi:hypothetical protein
LGWISIVAIIAGIVLSVFNVDDHWIIDRNNKLRIEANDQGFNYILHNLFSEDKESKLVSEWMIGKNIPALEGRFVTATPSSAADTWISGKSNIYYLHWAGFPGSLPLETVRTKAKTSNVVFSESTIKPMFTLFKKEQSLSNSSPAASLNVQIPKPLVDSQATKLFFESIEKIEPGADYGKVEWKNPEILIHPGNTKTSVTFKVSKEIAGRNIQMWMMTLPDEILKDSNAGTVKVDLKLNGKDFDQVVIDRFRNYIIDYKTQENDILELIVDKIDSPFWDGFRIGVE